MSKKVIILGGGVAGMSAAHELMERGFTVEVYEKKIEYCGGKARSLNVPGTNQQKPDKYLPGEHGFRFFPGFYKHVTDTMKRIPFSRNGVPNENGVFDNLVESNRVEIARYNEKPIVTIVNFPQSMADVKAAIDAKNAGTGLTDEEKELFARKIWQLMTSCYERRANDYERLGWWEYMDADQNSKNYQTLLVEGLTRTLVAANAKFASTKTGGDIFLQLLFNIADPFTHTDRVLNGPTNDVWLHPWHEYLSNGGVQYHYDTKAIKFEYNNGKIDGIWVSKTGAHEPVLVTGDYYILATPVEAAAPLLSDDMVAYDMAFAGIQELAKSVAWMNGMQFYLNVDVPIVHGHCIYADSEWAVTSISQMQFWDNYDLSSRGNGKVKGILSVDISNWQQPGINGKIADNCTPEEIKDEVWAQIKKSLNVNGQIVLSDEMLEYWHLDGDIRCTAKGQDANTEPLLVNTVNSWSLRPEAYCRISNLFLAADYVRTYTDLATMEGANEAARRAVNCILDVSGSDATPCEIWNLHEPDILAPLRAFDQDRYNKGLPYKIHATLAMKMAEEGLYIVKDVVDFFSGKK